MHDNEEEEWEEGWILWSVVFRDVFSPLGGRVGAIIVPGRSSVWVGKSFIYVKFSTLSLPSSNHYMSINLFFLFFFTEVDCD